MLDESKDNFENCTLIQKRIFENNRVIKDIYINGNGKEKHYVESVRMYSRNELVSGIEKAGLKVKNIFGGFRRGRF